MFRSAFPLVLLAAAACAQSDDAYDGSGAAKSLFLGSMGLAGSGVGCQTMISCLNQPGLTRTVSTVTTSVIGVFPSTVITVSPSLPGDDGTTTITILNPPTDSIHYITTSLSRGETMSTSIPSTGEPGSPGTMIVVPPGPPPASTTTVTTSLFGFDPHTTVTLPGRPPRPNEPSTELIVPPAASRPADWSCSCMTAAAATTTVTVTRSPEPAPTVTVTGTDGKATPTPASKFPCSGSDNDPCRGDVLKPWNRFYMYYKAGQPRNGPPDAFVTTVDVAHDSILTITDDENKLEHFQVTVDGKMVGETQEHDFDQKMYCGKDADSCIAKGWSHGYFPISKGSHELSIRWSAGIFNGGYGAGQWRLERVCNCTS